MAKKPIEFTFDKPKTWAELFGFGPQVQKQAEVIADQQKNALIDLYPQDYVDQQLSRENQQIEWAREDQLNDERLAAEERARISRENLYGQPSANPIDRARSVTVEAGSTPSGAPVGFETVSDTGPILRRVPEPPKNVGPLLSSAMTSMPDIGPILTTREEALAQPVPVDSQTTNSVTAGPGTDFFPDAPAAPEQKKGIRDTILETLGFSTPQEKQAFAMGMIASGGASLSAAAEGYNGWGSLGKGLQGFGAGYSNALSTAIDGDAKKAAIDASRQKQIKDAKADVYNQRMAQIIANGQNGNFGMTAEALNELAQMAIAAGDGDTARKALEYAQQVQQAAAKEGQIYNPQTGQFELAPGYAGGQYQVEQAKSAGRESGELPFRTTTDLTELDRVNAERSRNGLPPVSAEVWIRQSQSTKSAKPTGDDTFDSKGGEIQAKSFDEARVAGLQAKSKIETINKLQGALGNVQGGALTGMQQFASNYGIKLGDNASQLEYAQALINQIVPGQRPAGSGAMSDADLELFKRSVPALMNTPEGNRLIIETMRGIANYEAQIGQIAGRALAGEITRSEANRLMNEVHNPIETFRSAQGTSTGVKVGGSVMTNNGKVYIRR
ncbi:hypothetical protein CFBP4996_15370 [Agrobacterium leguminum]|uniref:Uncharacterized protein n=1 Tax=Agrobacterium deltaense NCPPB 1641 TaxID=1183425 RepID=A0A1S7U2F8_9HYPH|nr:MULTISPECIES: hypothetical protein [Agrobacterium]WFS67407.1 hypothetical protein CFBP4996_15370 [Agrobacterium leguminum]CVI61008.1 hypothetical protein AGR7A_Lc140059 [Agrobacterium deltaense NCPPB 1641]